MGTNYYGRPIKKIEDLKQKKKDALAQVGTMIGLIPVIEEHFDTKINNVQEIHLGKSSAGWRFLFNHNNWEYYQNIAEMKEWLKDYEVYSEYGERIFLNDFWAKVEEKQKMELAETKGSNKSWYIIKNGYEFSSSSEFC